MGIDVNTLIQVTFEKSGFNISFNVLSVCIQAKCTNVIARRSSGSSSFYHRAEVFTSDRGDVARFWVCCE